ncbi:Na+/H+ antiporter NhaC family protein [Slackia heliotrinireducens]|uniref:Na+/H+ antiporter NhaC family protein n=1 Tax=Slackia heliotrinireducens TaxID=84110 RepID=UPI0033163F44
MELGALSVLPVLIAIIGSLITRRPFECLLVGSLIGCIIMYGGGFLPEWTNMLQTTIADNVWIIAVCGLFGSLIALLTAARGTEGFSAWATKFCKTRRTTRVVTFILGVVIFVDDYLNMLTVGNCMRPVNDKLKMPRESLAFITGATGTPVCMLLPFSTWAAFYIALFQQQAEVQAMNFSSSIDLFMHFIPYNFFSITMVLITFLFALGIIPPIGPMKKAYKRVENGGTPWCEKSAEINQEDAEALGIAARPTMAESVERAEAELEAAAQAPADSHGEGKLIDFAIPMLALIVVTFVQDILVGVVVALAVCLVQYLIRKKMTIAEWTEKLYEGFADMIPTLICLMAAFMVAGTSGAMGLTQWVIDVAAGFPLPALFPAIVFVAVGFITFATGSFWGTSTIVTPILLPLAAAMGAPMMLTMGAILCGCTMGTQVCFFSDGNMLIATSVKNDLMENYFATLPYLGMAIGLTLVCLIMGGFVMA